MCFCAELATPAGVKDPLAPLRCGFVLEPVGFDPPSGGLQAIRCERAAGQPVPARTRQSPRPGEAHDNPLEPFASRGRYRTKLVTRTLVPSPTRSSSTVHAMLSHRDMALDAFYVSTGFAPRSVGASVGHADPGQQLITVIHKASRALQAVPASPDAFVWLHRLT